MDGHRWPQILRGTVSQIRVDNVPLLAGGVAFYAMLALVPAMAAAVSLYGLVVSQAQVDRQIASLTAALPPAAGDLITTQLKSITASSSGGLRLSFAVGLGAALWSASSGMRWLLAALTAASGGAETRKFVKLRSVALLMTLGAIVGLGISLGALLALPALFDQIGLAGAARVVLEVVRFPVLGALILAGLAVLYRYGPDRTSEARVAARGKKGRVRWLTWGSGTAAVVWLVGSTGLTIYVTNASKFKAAGTYGALGAVVVLLLWLWISSFAVILGAVVNTQVSEVSEAE
jgi:membrane protein